MIRRLLLATFVLLCGEATSQSDKLEIFNNPINPPTIVYCKGQLRVTDAVSIEGRDLNQANDGIKVSISNYRFQEDTLIYKGSVPGITASWDNSKGEIIFSGNSSAAGYQEAIRQVFYENLAEIPTLGNRNLVVSLSDADYLPHTGHFYKYIPALGIWWTAARDSAQNMTYNGLKGYLATITSEAENNFIWEKTKGVGWIGASDSAVEGVWRWVTGPEAGTQFWQGGANGSPVNGMYSNWNNGEPNNVQKTWGEDEDYAHINMNPNAKPRSWNDLPNRSDGAGSQWYYSQGFIVEFGGMPGDPVLRLSAGQTISIDKIAFSKNRNPEICRGDSVTLNVSTNAPYVYSWSPGVNISSVNRPNPTVKPSFSTSYRAVASLSDRCRDTADFHVTVHDLPVSSLDAAYPLCSGSSLALDPGVHKSYLWSNGETGQTITVSQPGTYSVSLRNDYCPLRATTSVFFSPRPVLDVNPADTLVCGELRKRLPLSLGTGTLLLTAFSHAGNIIDGTTLNPELVVPAFGTYRYNLETTNPDGCSFDTLVSISFRHQPTAVFNVDSGSCYGYNLQVEYKGDRQGDAYFQWFSADTLFSEGLNLEQDTIPLGSGDDIERSVNLSVNENGCIAISPKVKVKVKPDLGFELGNTEGCSPLDVQVTSVTKPTVVQWSWDFGDGKGALEKDAVHQYQNFSDREEHFSVSLKVKDNKGCENSDIISNAIVVYPEPLADFAFRPERILVSNPGVEFENRSVFASDYLWDFGDGSALSNEESPRHRFPGLGVFDVALLAANNWGCTNRTTLQAVVVFDKLFPPNAFSPNSVNEEDHEFRIYAEGINPEGYRLRIYNRWGEVVFESISAETGWDGKMKNGNNAPAGIYTWIVQYFDFMQVKHHQQGTVTLLY
jgi:gliding motility-associated-like protein